MVGDEPANIHPSPAFLPFHLAFIILKCVFLWERGVWSLGSGVVSEALRAFPLFLLSLFFPVQVGGCTMDALQIQRRVNFRFQAFLTQRLLHHLSLPDLCGSLFSKPAAWKRLLSVTCQIFPQSLTTSCDPKGSHPRLAPPAWAAPSGKPEQMSCCPHSSRWLLKGWLSVQPTSMSGKGPHAVLIRSPAECPMAPRGPCRRISSPEKTKSGDTGYVLSLPDILQDHPC